MSPSFPRSRDDLSPQVYVTLLLLACIKQHGGELRLPAILLENIRGGESVLHDWDPMTQELVLRVGTPCAEMLALPEEAKWHATLRPSSVPLLTPTPISATQAGTSRVRTDEELAEMEQEQRKAKTLAMHRDRAQAMTELFQATPDAALRKDQA